MGKKLSLLMFSGEFDKALAALVLANTAREMDMEVTMFFAFWGLSLVRDPDEISDEDKTLWEKMIAGMTPKGIENLPLSKMNFAGIGKKMLEEMMEDSDTPPITAFFKGALNKGVVMKACKLSCEVMGFSDKELLDEVEIITAEDYLKDALESDIQLFI
ncbi:MAG: DsrE/DsrF/DrsH-like family protein [Tissierellaceae bacterium]|nr:DsrE/DsrF/DrsH-like family protein [Tissierellaceae bacterium]